MGFRIDDLARAYKTLDSLFIVLRIILKLEGYDSSSTSYVMDPKI
jgi:hypothetical protein